MNKSCHVRRGVGLSCFVFATVVIFAADAQAGAVRRLEAGILKGPILLAPGESLLGAGYGKSIIDARGSENGIVVSGGSGAVVSDLTVEGASGANVLVKGAKGATLARVRATGGLLGISFADAQSCRVENAGADANHDRPAVGPRLVEGDGGGAAEDRRPRGFI